MKSICEEQQVSFIFETFWMYIIYTATNFQKDHTNIICFEVISCILAINSCYLWILLVRFQGTIFIVKNLFDLGIHIFAYLPVSYSSSSQLASVYQWHAHSREVVFHTLQRGQIDTRLYPLIS